MKITRTSMVSGVECTLELPITQEQYDAWKGGQLIQDAMPHLTPGQREFLITGITDEVWDAIFSEDSDEEEGFL